MTKVQAIEQVIKESEKSNKTLSSLEIAFLAQERLDKEKETQRKRNEYNVLSAKNGGTRAKVMTTLNQLTIPVLRDLTVSTASEFLGEEFWLSLNTMSEKLIAKRVFNEMRVRLTRGMC